MKKKGMGDSAAYRNSYDIGGSSETLTNSKPQNMANIVLKCTCV